MEQNYRAWDIDLIDFHRMKKDEDKLRFLLRFAVLAPSSHNSQPWSFGVTAGTISVMPNTKRMLSVSDKNCRQLYISLGCALENILIAADFFGISYAVEYSLDTCSDHCIKVSFDLNNIGKRTGDDEHLVFWIPQRHTDRNIYREAGADTESVRENVAARLFHLKVRGDLVSDSFRKNAVADCVLDAMNEAMSDKAFRLELSGYLKSNYTSSGLGMPGFGLGIPGPVSVLVPFIVRFANISKLSRKQDEKLLKVHTPVFGILSTEYDDAESWVKAGQAYERIALQAEKKGLRTAVMAAAIQIGDYNKELQKILGIKFRPQVFFRLGRSDHSVRPSPRLEAEDVEER